LKNDRSELNDLSTREPQRKSEMAQRWEEIDKQFRQTAESAP
jgi:hypothetical protein